MKRKLIANDKITLPLKITGKWAPIILIWVLMGWPVPFLFFKYKTFDSDFFKTLLIELVFCLGIYLYQKCHVIILTKDTLKYRGLGNFFRWLKINLNDIENEEIDIGYGPELKRTGIVARWYLLDKNNKELGVINFKAFADKDIAKVFQYVHNKKNKTEEESIEEPDKDLQEEIKESTWDFYKRLLKIPLYMLIILAIASIYRLLVMWFQK